MRRFVNRCSSGQRKHGAPMFDAAMLIGGIGVFALFLGYVSICENL
jgi:hypothetical protein